MKAVGPDGHRFETQLLRPVRSYYWDLGYLTFDEFRTQWGVSDLVCIKPDIDQCLRRIEAGQIKSIGDPSNIMVLLSIPAAESNQACSESELESRFRIHFSNESLQKILHVLLRRRLIARTLNGSFQRHTPWLPYHTQIVSIELKLNRIQEVLRQAIHHKAFTELSYAALPKDLANKIVNSPKVSPFKDAGVGILGVTKEVFQELLPPTTGPYLTHEAFAIATAERGWPQFLKTIQH